LISELGGVSAVCPWETVQNKTKRIRSGRNGRLGYGNFME
jgi:hypothetical protein